MAIFVSKSEFGREAAHSECAGGLMKTVKPSLPFFVGGLEIKKVLSSIVCIWIISFSIPVFAELKTFVKEYTYQASEIDSKRSCRVIALEQVKRLLLEELGTYLESYTEVKNYQLSTDKIVTLTAGIVSTKIITESFDGKIYCLKAELKADSNSVAQSVLNYRNDWHKMRELVDLRKKTDQLRSQISELKRQLVYYPTKDKGEKIQDYNKQIDSLNAIDWIEKGTVFYNGKKYKDAIFAFSKAIELEPNTFISYNGRGLSYEYNNNHREAIEDFNIALKFAPDNQWKSLVLSNRSMPHIRLGNYDEAMKDCNQAIALDPENYMAFNNRGITQKFLMVIEAAKADFDTAIKINSQFSSLYGNRGMIYAITDNFNQAMVDLNKAVELDSKNAYAYSWRGAVYAYLDKMHEAIIECDTSINLDPNNAELYVNYAMVLFLGKRYMLSIEKANKAIILNPKLPGAYNKRGMSYSELGYYDKALHDLNKAIILNPKSPFFYVNRGKIYAKIKKYEFAIKDCENAIQFQPESKIIRKQVALCYAVIGLDLTDLGQYEQSIMYLSRAIKFNPNKDLFYSIRGDTYSKFGDFKKAAEDFTRAINIKPNYLDYVGRGLSYEMLGNIKKAIKDYDEAVKLNSKSGVPYYYRGMAYYKSGDYQRGMADIRISAKNGEKKAQDFLNRPLIKW